MSPALQEDIDSTKKVLEAVRTLCLFVTGTVLKGWQPADLFRAIQMLSDIAAVAAAAKQILPELKDLDKEEAQEICGLLYDTVRDVIEMVKAAKA